MSTGTNPGRGSLTEDTLCSNLSIFKQGKKHISLIHNRKESLT
jgi:hypothetical protein